MIEVRKMRSGEANELGRVMWNAIHHGRSLYTEAQRQAWLASPPEGPDWQSRLASQAVWLAFADERVAGFVTLAEKGYVDFAYVHAEYQGQGVFSVLLAALEDAARGLGHPRLWTHASLMAEAAFFAHGFRVTHRETVTRAGQQLDRAQMEKVLI